MEDENLDIEFTLITDRLGMNIQSPLQNNANFTQTKVYYLTHYHTPSCRPVKSYFRIAYKIFGDLFQTFASTLFNQRETIRQKYQLQSLAIVQNANGDFADAMRKSKEYNIPLIQFVLRCQESEKFMNEKFLQEFQIANFLNQNFIFYADRSEYEQLSLSGRLSKSVIFRKCDIVYAELPIQTIKNISIQELGDILMELRNFYYTFQRRLDYKNCIHDSCKMSYLKAWVSHIYITQNRAIASEAFQLRGDLAYAIMNNQSQFELIDNLKQMNWNEIEQLKNVVSRVQNQCKMPQHLSNLQLTKKQVQSVDLID